MEFEEFLSTFNYEYERFDSCTYKIKSENSNIYDGIIFKSKKQIIQAMWNTNKVQNYIEKKYNKKFETKEKYLEFSIEKNDPIKRILEIFVNPKLIKKEDHGKWYE